MTYDWNGSLERREHLSRGEQTARSDGAHYVATGNPGLQSGGPVITAWRFGEGQAYPAVVQL